MDMAGTMASGSKAGASISSLLVKFHSRYSHRDAFQWQAGGAGCVGGWVRHPYPQASKLSSPLP
jgi:hypothetical protein